MLTTREHHEGDVTAVGILAVDADVLAARSPWRNHMHTIDPTITLGELVTLHPELARELEVRHLDYCCGGSTSLADACTSADLDPAAVAAQLGAVASPPSSADWTAFDSEQLVDHLEATHHRYLWEELPRLEALMAKVLSVHGERHPGLAAVADAFHALRAELEPHLMKEERVLFPMIREMAHDNHVTAMHCGSVGNPISVMLTEHDAAGDLLAKLRRVTDDYRPPTDGCASYHTLFTGLDELEHDTHEHIHKENHRLFPLALDLERRLKDGP